MPVHQRGARPTLGDTAATDDLARVVAEEVVLGFGMIGVPHADGVAARDALRRRCAEVHLDRSIDYPGMASLTVAPRASRSGTACGPSARAHGLRDGPRARGGRRRRTTSSCSTTPRSRAVPAVAHPAALARADHVIPAAADGGWADILALL